MTRPLRAATPESAMNPTDAVMEKGIPRRARANTPPASAMGTAVNTTSAGQQAAAIAVEQSINIPPTLNKHHGELVSIFVARDLDFSGIYRLRVTEPRNRILDRAVLGDFAPQSTIVTK